MMFQKFSDGSSSVWNERFLPLWFCFIWINIAPFLSLYRTGPLSSFYLEAGSLTGAALLVLVTAYCGLLNVKFSATAKCLLVLAAFWWAQARLMNLTYPGMNDMVVWTFIILALAAWACRGWIAEYGQERAVTIFAWTLLFGALAQAVIAVLQFNGLSGTGLLRGITAYANKDGISGQLGQRNHLGHYLMWGTLSAAYLWAQRKMPAWLGFLLVAGLAGVMGLVNSRTILTYVIGVGLLLPFWRWRAGREANRLTAVMLFAVLAVFFFQFSMGHILEWLGNGSYETAVERVGTSSFEGSARQIEAKKAWLAFQTAPFFGHGWNSYALQSFLVNAEQQNYANNILGVLFTHAHNIVLNLLAEMGLVGTLLVAACILTAVWRMLSRPNHPASLLLLATMTVSMCHSMLEYPLWYIYFLTPFCLMLSLSPAQQQDVSDGLMQAKLRNLGGGLLALGIIAGILQLGWTYTNLTEYSQQQKTDTAVKIQQKISGLKQIAADSPMLRYYAELGLARHFSPTDNTINPVAEKAALAALTYRPYANAHQVGLYYQRQGKTAEARKWMQAMYYYYPYHIPYYQTQIAAHPALQPLAAEADVQCQTAYGKFLRFEKLKKITCTAAVSKAK